MVIVVVILLLLRSCGAPVDDHGGIEFDPSATEGGWDEADTDEIIAGLNEKVEEGMINISMNTSPVFADGTSKGSLMIVNEEVNNYPQFADGTSKGSLMIVNEEVNNYPQVVEISRDDTGELIYKSGAIPVGSKIESAKPSVDLDPGTYKCTALFYNVDPDTGDYLGCAGAVVTVTVLE